MPQAPSSDGQAAQQAPTSSKGKPAVKKNSANPSQEPAATTAAAAAAAAAAGDQASAKAAVAEAGDGATAPRSSKSGAEKQKRRADQAGTSAQADTPAQANTSTASAQVERTDMKKKSKKSKADQVGLYVKLRRMWKLLTARWKFSECERTQCWLLLWSFAPPLFIALGSCCSVFVHKPPCAMCLVGASLAGMFQARPHYIQAMYLCLYCAALPAKNIGSFCTGCSFSSSTR